MKKTSALLLFLIAMPCLLWAKDGYKIKINLTDKKDSMVYLAYYFGKSLPTIFKIDSAKLDKTGNAVFEKKEKITGGIYIILPEDRKGYFEILVNNGDEFSVTAAMKELPESIKFKNSQENEDYIKYQKYLKEFALKQQQWQKDLAASKSKEDTANIRNKYKDANSDLTAYRKAYVQGHKGSLMSSIFNALEPIQVPEGEHYLPDGKVDSFFGYRFYKTHYWDNFNFKDDRLIHTPLLETKLDEYFNKVIYQQEDSVIKYADSLIAKVKGTENLFKFTLNWLSTNAQTSKVMGMDKVFVHLVEQYYMKGIATWLSNDDLKKFIDRANEIAPNILNKQGPDLKAVDINNKEYSLYNFKAKYTLLVFYSPDCSHCIHEMPLLDSVYHAALKAKGVKVIAFNVDVEEQKWTDFIKKNKLTEWLHVWDPKRKSRYWASYDVQTTPTIYLLDENKIIRGKKLDYSTVDKAIEIAEMRKKGKK